MLSQLFLNNIREICTNIICTTGIPIPIFHVLTSRLLFDSIFIAARTVPCLSSIPTARVARVLVWPCAHTEFFFLFSGLPGSTLHQTLRHCRCTHTGGLMTQMVLPPPLLHCQIGLEYRPLMAPQPRITGLQLIHMQINM